MKIGLVPMSAKPFHRGHAGLIEIAASENDQVLVFVGFGSRGIKKRKKQKRKFEQPLEDEFPIYGDTMRKVWLPRQSFLPFMITFTKLISFPYNFFCVFCTLLGM